MNLIPSPINGYACPEDTGEPGTNAPRLSVNNDEARIVSELLRGRWVLEIGTGLGVMTHALAAVTDLIVTVDIDPWVQENIVPTLPKHVQFTTNAESIGVLHWFDAAMIDGSHKYEDVMRDIGIVRKLVKPGGLLIFHDLYLSPIYNALTDSKVNFIHIQSIAGLAVAWND
jgi:predicted O-methyltransferase YrrM